MKDKILFVGGIWDGLWKDSNLMIGNYYAVKKVKTAYQVNPSDIDESVNLDDDIYVPSKLSCPDVNDHTKVDRIYVMKLETMSDYEVWSRIMQFYRPNDEA